MSTMRVLLIAILCTHLALCANEPHANPLLRTKPPQMALLTIKVVLRSKQIRKLFPTATIIFNYSTLGSTNKYGQFISRVRASRHRFYTLLIKGKGKQNSIVIRRLLPKRGKKTGSAIYRHTIYIQLDVSETGKLRIMGLPKQLKPAQIKAVIQHYTWLLKACRSLHTEQGPVYASWQILKSGKTVAIKLSNAPSKALRYCIKQQIQLWRFPRFTGPTMKIKPVPFPL